LGLLLFAFTIQGTLECADVVHANADALAVHDDVCPVGAASGVRSAFHEVSRGAAAIGLSIATRKCRAYRHNQAPATETACSHGLQHQAEGIVAAGCPVGNSEKTSCHSKGIAAKVCVLLSFLKQYPLALQDRFLLLHKSLVPRLVYLTGPPRHL
jgi:hypothetical protein